MPAATAGSHSLTTDEVDLYNRDVQPEGCTAFEVQSDSANATLVLINVPGLHGTDWFPIPPGNRVAFRVSQRALSRVRAKMESGTGIVHAGVVAKV